MLGQSIDRASSSKVREIGKAGLFHQIWSMITKVLKTMLRIKRLKVIKGFNCANTAPLKAIQKIMTKKSNIIFKAVPIVPINSTMAAAEPMQLCPIMAMVE